MISNQKLRFDKILKKNGITLLAWQKKVAYELLEKPPGSGVSLLLHLLYISEHYLERRRMLARFHR